MKDQKQVNDANDDIVSLLCEETKARELKPEDFPSPPMDVELSDAEKITVARAAWKNGRVYTAFRILQNLKEREPLKRGGCTESRAVRKFLEAL